MTAKARGDFLRLSARRMTALRALSGRAGGSGPELRRLYMRWFGKPWGAEACDPASHVETPVGEICMWCDEPIAEEDRGFLMPHLGAAVRGIA